MENKYKYIVASSTKTTDRICDHDLYSRNQLGCFHTAIKVNIPSDFEFGFKIGSYWDTFDQRTLEELGCDVIVRFKGKWETRNDLKHLTLGEIYKQLETEGYVYTNDGFITKELYYKRIDRKDKENRKIFRIPSYFMD